MGWEDAQTIERRAAPARVWSRRSPAVRDEQIVDRRDYRLGPLLGLGLAFASRRVWPNDCLNNALFVYFFGKTRRPFVEVGVLFLPWVFLSGIVIVVHRLVAPPPTLSAELGFWLVVAVVQIVTAPLVGFVSLAFGFREYSRRLNTGLLEELSLCPNVRPAHVVYGLLARTSAACTLGIATYLLTTASYAHACVFSHSIGSGLEGLLMLVLTALMLFAAYSSRVFCDRGLAVAARAAFLYHDPSPAISRGIRDYLLWAPVLFFLLPVGFGLLSGLITFLQADLLILPLALLFLFLIANAAAIIEERAADTLEWTMRRPAHWGYRTGGDSMMIPPSIAAPWPSK